VPWCRPTRRRPTPTAGTWWVSSYRHDSPHSGGQVTNHGDQQLIMPGACTVPNPSPLIRPDVTGVLRDLVSEIAAHVGTHRFGHRNALRAAAAGNPAAIHHVGGRRPMQVWPPSTPDADQQPSVTRQAVRRPSPHRPLRPNHLAAYVRSRPWHESRTLHCSAARRFRTGLGDQHGCR